MKHPTNAETRRLEALCEDLSWFFDMRNKEELHRFHDDPAPDSHDCAADVTLDERYQRLTINFYPRFWELSLEQQRKALLHEYTHTIIAPVQEIAQSLREGHLVTDVQLTEAVERVTSSIENRLDGLLQGRYRFLREGYANYSRKPVKRLSPSKAKKKRS